MTSPRRMTRSDMLAALMEPGVWDVIILGGGATGLGAAVDAASRGCRTLLLEARDFAHGTSSRSTKLIHGGVRYLRNGQLPLVREGLLERERLLRNAPHLVHPLPFILPTFRAGRRWFYYTGLKLYDLLARSAGFASSQLLSPRDIAHRMPGLRQHRLTGGVIYHDGQFDDARLAIHLARTFADLGGVALNYAPATRLLSTDNRITGVVAVDELTQTPHELHARAVINATGVFSDLIRRFEQPDAPASVTASQGAHIVLDRSFLGSDAALMIPDTDDGRVLFAIPWHDRLLVGTTDVLVQTVDIEPRPLDEEIEFLLDHAGRYFTKKPSRADVRSVFAGLRPLVKPTGDACATGNISRDCSVTVSSAGLVSIAGGKWTTYRRMGEMAVDAALKVAGLSAGPSRTADLPIHGSAPHHASSAAWNTYGSDAPFVETLAADDARLLEPYDAALPCRPVDVMWSVREEMAMRLDDVLSRRTRCLLLDARATLAIAPSVAALMQAELRRDDGWRLAELDRFTALARRYLV